MSDLVLNSLSIFEVDSLISFSNVEGKLKIIGLTDTLVTC